MRDSTTTINHHQPPSTNVVNQPNKFFKQTTAHLKLQQIFIWRSWTTRQPHGEHKPREHRSDTLACPGEKNEGEASGKLGRRLIYRFTHWYWHDACVYKDDPIICCDLKGLSSEQYPFRYDGSKKRQIRSCRLAQRRAVVIPQFTS